MFLYAGRGGWADHPWELGQPTWSRRCGRCGRIPEVHPLPRTGRLLWEWLQVLAGRR